jgi:hypothetical protein
MPLVRFPERSHECGSSRKIRIIGILEIRTLFALRENCRLGTQVTVTHRRSRCAILFTGLGGLLVGCVTLIHYTLQPQNGIRVEMLKSDFPRHLKVGCPKQVVQRWFISNGIETHEIVDHQNLRPIGLSATLPNDSLILAASIEIECYFDSNDRLESWLIERILDFW